MKKRKITLPSFCPATVRAQELQFKKILSSNRHLLKQLFHPQKKYSWENLMIPFEEMNEKLHQCWGIIAHWHSVNDTAIIRKIYNRCLPRLSRYSTEVAHHKKLYEAILSLKSNVRGFGKFSDAQKKVIEDHLRDFQLSGIALSAQDKKQFKQIEEALVKLSATFSEHVLDATQAWTCPIKNERKLLGLPAYLIENAKKEALKRSLEGFVLTLDYPVYHGVLTFAENRPLRQLFYRAYATRASDQSEQPQFDNSTIMKKILKARDQLAHLIDFDDYASYSLTTKMAKTPKTVASFLNQLIRQVKPAAKKEYRELQQFALEKYGVKKLMPWDVAYYSEKLRQARYHISEEQLRAYFPEKKVVDGMFKLAEQLFDIRIKGKKNKNVWDKTVKYFEVLDRKNRLRGHLYADLYVRPSKQSGAWMNDCRCRWKLPDKRIQTPVAFLVCNFNAPSANHPSNLTHREVETLFHEFGHCLHHLLTKADYPEISGINGVEWDAVELPSQLMENFCWDYRVLQWLTAHEETGEPISRGLYKKLWASKNFQSGLSIHRQLMFALFDFCIHHHFEDRPSFDIQKTLHDIQKRHAVFSVPRYSRFGHSFAHIFSGGYAAGYYSYLWAEVLSADAFEKFKKAGVINKKIGREFSRAILEKGATKKAIDQFIDFRGRKPDTQALLKSIGISDRS